MERATTSKKPLPCDQCHRRKVRCDYERPCKRCTDSHAECTYAVVRKKRGPKGRRTLSVTDTLASTSPGTVDHVARGAESMHLDRLMNPASISSPAYALSHDEAQDGAIRSHEGGYNAIRFDEFAQSILSGNAIPEEHASRSVDRQRPTPATPFTGRRLDRTAVVDRCVDLFYSDLYPTYPLISRSYVDACLRSPTELFRSDVEMIWAMCALTLAHVDNWPDMTPDHRTMTARRYIRKVRESRVEWDMDSPCFTDIMTSLFMAVAFFEPRGKTASWIYLREAITIAHALRLDKEETYADLDEATAVRYRRAYALLFITERGSAIMYSTPVTVLLPPALPKVALPDENASVCMGLEALHSLFALLDMKFVNLWNENTISSSTAHVNASDLALLQQHLRELRLDHAGLSDTQRADVLITQQWLRLIIWHATLKQGLISSAATDPCFDYTYPVDIGMYLCGVVKGLPPSAVSVHGLGIFEKQFEIAYSMMDALSMSEDAPSRQHECLRYLLLSLSLSPTSRQIYVRTLEKAMTGNLERAMTVGQKYRSLHDVQLLVDDSPSRQASRRASLAVI